MATLGDYLTATQRLLRDESTSLYSAAELTAFITEARHVRDLDTRLVRKQMGFTLTGGVSTYKLSDISAATFLMGETACIARDIISANVLTQGGVPGGIGFRYPLARKAFSFMSPYISQSFQSYPAMFQLYGFDTVVLAPVSAFAYPTEWDLVGVYPDLVQPTDVDPMPAPYTDPLPYLAAAIAKDNAQRFDEAQQFKTQYKERMQVIREGIRQITVSDPYFGR